MKWNRHYMLSTNFVIVNLTWTILRQLTQKKKNYIGYICFGVSQNCGKRIIISPCLSFRLHKRTDLPQKRFSWNFIIEYFSRIRRENSDFIKKSQKYRIFYMRTCEHLRRYLALCFLEWEMFQANIFLIKSKSKFCIQYLSRKSCLLNITWKIMEKIEDLRW